jgi:hypothetical protein
VIAKKWPRYGLFGSAQFNLNLLNPHRYFPFEHHGMMGPCMDRLCSIYTTVYLIINHISGQWLKPLPVNIILEVCNHAQIKISPNP